MGYFGDKHQVLFFVKYDSVVTYAQSVCTIKRCFEFFGFCFNGVVRICFYAIEYFGGYLFVEFLELFDGFGVILYPTVQVKPLPLHATSYQASPFYTPERFL